MFEFGIKHPVGVFLLSHFLTIPVPFWIHSGAKIFPKRVRRPKNRSRVGSGKKTFWFRTPLPGSAGGSPKPSEISKNKMLFFRIIENHSNAAYSMLHVVRCVLYGVWCSWHVVWCMLYVMCCRLYVACCMVDAGWCSLYAVCCALPHTCNVLPCNVMWCRLGCTKCMGIDKYCQMGSVSRYSQQRWKNQGMFAK